MSMHTRGAFPVRERPPCCLGQYRRGRSRFLVPIPADGTITEEVQRTQRIRITAAPPPSVARPASANSTG